jgi:DNA-binding transcriptional ArsR family regulator
MRAKPAFRDREQVEVAVLDALAERAEDGMTVLELRAQVDADIDSLERGLTALERDGLIEVSQEGSRTLIRPADHVVGPVEDEDEPSGLDAIIDRFRP